ncbi:MAG TPA: twin-arginine translocation signal domain-containing protein, partial [Acidisoma sp.]|nr:twin-arginine translocation signal domain-containing protein [Acidisoma sp.]
MLIKRQRGWEAPGRDVTPEAVFHSRRTLMKGAAVMGGVAAFGSLGLSAACADDAEF